MKEIRDEILSCQSLSIVGMEKNTGKTETLNYLLGALRREAGCVAVTSVGIDGESVDSVTLTAKPDITLYPGMLFTTSEQHYLQRQLTAEIVMLSQRRTALGRTVTARALTEGKVLLSGPSDTASLQQQIADNRRLGATLTLVDGALSRMSLASPTVTEAMILATGAALTPQLPELIAKTRFVCDLIALPTVDAATKNLLCEVEKGMHAIDADGKLHDLGIASALLFESQKEQLLRKGTRLYVAGMVGDKLLDFLRMQKADNIRLIVKDFTKLFVSRAAYSAFVRRGGRIELLYGTRLLALTLNPTSPQGYRFDSDEACRALSEALHLPVYDVRNSF